MVYPAPLFHQQQLSTSKASLTLFHLAPREAEGRTSGVTIRFTHRREREGERATPTGRHRLLYRQAYQPGQSKAQTGVDLGGPSFLDIRTGKGWKRWVPWLLS